MADINKLCMGCMREMPDFSPECPYCKFDSTTENDEKSLPLKTMLESRYIVGKVLYSNGEGITYIGYDCEQNMPVRIREFFPFGLCDRINVKVKYFSDSESVFVKEMTAFLELARSLARMRGLSAILPVYDIFEANGTAYYISETIESITLRDFLIRNGGALTFEQIRPLFMPIMSTLNSLHAVDIIHRGISPDTLIIGKDGKIRLTEFCVADARTARSDIPCELFKGYAAIEQYGFEGDQGPWTDVYAIAATIYRSLVGSPPPEATSRVTNDKLIIPAQIADSLPAYIMSGLANALQILPNERTQNIETFRDEFSASPNVVTKAATKAAESKPVKRKQRSTKKYVLISALITLVILCLIFVLVYGGIKSANPNSNETTVPTLQQGTTRSYSDSIIDPDSGTTPNLVGYLYADVMSSSDEEIIKATTKYTIDPSSKIYSEKAAGTILSQVPAAGSKIKKGDTISVIISLGPKTFAMPDLTGKTKEEAIMALWKAGFSMQNVSFEEKYSPTSAEGTVVDVSPSANEKVNGDIYVTVYMNSYVPETTKQEFTQPVFNNDTTTYSDDGYYN